MPGRFTLPTWARALLREKQNVANIIETIKEMNKEKLHRGQQLNETLESFVEDVVL